MNCFDKNHHKGSKAELRDKISNQVMSQISIIIKTTFVQQVRKVVTVEGFFNQSFSFLQANFMLMTTLHLVQFRKWLKSGQIRGWKLREWDSMFLVEKGNNSMRNRLVRNPRDCHG